MEYKELIPNIKWNCPPDKNISILVLCHSIHTSYYVNKMKDFVWDRFSAITIWQTKDKINDRCRLAEEVNQMDAVICFVTELLISSPNEIGDYLLPVIIENKQPLLPIVDKISLEAVFDKKYGHIHFVKFTEKHMIPFETIEKFIKGVQIKENKRYQWLEVNDDNFENFSQSYFISYRKTDGKYVDYVQRRIHEEAQLLDTQLWYDSYLVPGEDYDANLIKIIEKCTAVLLLVTPHLLDPDNYVLKVEVPYARACGKTVIAIVLEDTDLEMLRSLYNIEKVYRLDEWKSFTDILDDAQIMLPDIKLSPKHLVQIATAYLDGNGVERNVEIACEILYQAFQYNYPAAYEKLIEIKSGEYEERQKQYAESAKNIALLEECTDSEDSDNTIKRLSNIEKDEQTETYKDIGEAKELFEKYINLLNAEYQNSKSERIFITLLDYLRRYGEFYLNQGKLEEAYLHLLKFYECIKDYVKNEVNEFCTYLSVASLLLAKTLDKLGDYEKAEEYFRKSVDIDRMLNDDDSTHDAITYTNLLTSLCELGEYLQKRGKLLKAKIMYQEVLETIQNNYTFYGTEWEPFEIFNGYIDENSAEKTEETERFARISLGEIEMEIFKIGKFRPKTREYSRDYITDSRILDNCDNEKIQLLSHEIMINSIPKIKWLVEYLSNIDCDFDICQKKYCMNAKNLIAVMTLDISNTCELIVHSIDLESSAVILEEIVHKMND